MGCIGAQYDAASEFRRLGLPNNDFRLTEVNKTFEMCSTYPALLCVPNVKGLTDQDLMAVGAFRSRARIPALCWIHPISRATIWRCSQPGAGVSQSRCAEDERYNPRPPPTSLAATSSFFYAPRSFVFCHVFLWCADRL